MTRKNWHKLELGVLLLALFLLCLTLFLYWRQSGFSATTTVAKTTIELEQTIKSGDESVLAPSMNGSVVYNSESTTSNLAEQPSAELNPYGYDEQLTALTAAPEQETALERIRRLISPDPPGALETEYMIRVFLDKQMVCVFTDDGSKNYNFLLKAFPCCTALVPGNTPTGKHKIGIKYLFGYMIDGSYGQYCSEYTKTMYFHGMPSYNNEPEAGVRWFEFNNLGNPASHGCIRLTCKDAKWIYDYVKEGTEVEVLEESAGFPQLPKSIDFVKMKEGGPSWDPTNPNPQNPYQLDPSLLLP